MYPRPVSSCPRPASGSIGRARWERFDPGRALLAHHDLAYKRLYVDCILRLGVAVGIIGATLFARQVLRIAELDVPALLAVALLIGGYDVLTYLLLRASRDPGETAQRRLTLARHATVALDHLGLTGLVYLAGGGRSPFLAVFLLHLVFNSLMMSRLAAYLHAGMAYSLLAGLVVGEWSGWLPCHMPAARLWSDRPLDGHQALVTLAVYGILFVVIVSMLTSLAELLRAEQHKVQRANHELGRVSQSRRDLLHVALHNLKSPLAAVTMLLANLEAEVDGPLTDRQRDRLRRSLLRLEQASAFLRDLHVLALLESGEFDQQAAPTDVGQMLRDVVEDHRELAEARQHSVSITLPADLPSVHGIQRLLREALANFVTNAIKYTPPGGRIVVRAEPENSQVRVEVEDNGIGIAPDDEAELFAEFRPLRARHAAGADAPGSGLGLSIAKRIVETHGGTVHVTSRVGSGSVFAMLLPTDGRGFSRPG